MSDIKKLKSLLEGTRIVSINESKNPEALCRFCVERGDERTSFTLYATDLGHWAGDIVHDGLHCDMTSMLESIYNHVYGCKKIIRHIKEPGLMGYFECDCGESFIVLEENIEILKSKQLKKGDILIIPKHKQIKKRLNLKTEEFLSTFSII
ncbi:hypothetical protein LCGC14_1775080 [marine sediment metagenome]|uniref:Uncharacterized protein n=1 Tax=marine sediment metagenome TaxID=412755 RepID=A0A0F9GX38_9ZZZZ